MQLNLMGDSKAKSASGVQVSDAIFAREFNEALVHQVIVAYQAGGRAGTHAQKTRSEVSGGGIKPWKQKGTGRARAGTIRSPLWRKGGIIFAARPQDYSQKVNKKMYQAAMRSILSELIRQNRLMVSESFTVEAPKTRSLVSKLKEHDLKNVLIIVDATDDNLNLAARNLYEVEVREVPSVDPVSLISYEKVLITVNALKKLEELLT